MSFKKFLNSIRSHKTEIEAVHIIASVATIIALIIAIASYYDYKSIQKENEQIILDNALLEIDWNLFVALDLIKSEQYYLETYEFIVNRYRFFYLEKSSSIIKDLETRQKIFRLVQGMRGTNILMGRIT